MPIAASLELIKQVFDREFSAWEIVLPTETLTDLRPGSILKRGWTINFQFGTAGGMQYLEYFASHRMTNDTLNRVYGDGRQELLGFCQEFYEAGNAEAQRDYFAHNRSFYEEVERKGLQ